jgi:hypothetical protein
MAATNSMKTSKTKKTVILLMAQKFVTRNLWASHVWEHPEKLGISIWLQSLHQHLQERQWLFWKLEIISDSHRESICICSDSWGVLMSLNKRSLILNNNPQNKRKTTDTEET